MKIAWVVDVQNDFMTPPEKGGRLYVRDLFQGADTGAIGALPAIEAAVAWANTNADLLVYTGDWHREEDAEIDRIAPDATRGTYPPHCMGLSSDPTERAGAEIIESIRPTLPLVLQRDATPTMGSALAILALTEKSPVFIQKNQFDVFTGNLATDAFVRSLRDFAGECDIEVYVFGVARDVCVTQAIDALRHRGVPVVAVTDAMWGLGLEAAEDTFARWREAGTRFTTVNQLPGSSHEARRTRRHV